MFDLGSCLWSLCQVSTRFFQVWYSRRDSLVVSTFLLLLWLLMAMQLLLPVAVTYLPVMVDPHKTKRMLLRAMVEEENVHFVLIMVFTATLDCCYKLHGYPPGYKARKIAHAVTSELNSPPTTKDAISEESVTLSRAQY
ncbi:unnamed protein product [Linum trigynum]|uniref:Uncharacterized protein n=1 Tax=Linum trigynum TaxID=586398 RepID=A0AAV2G9E1_9ROSI